MDDYEYDEMPDLKKLSKKKRIKQLEKDYQQQVEINRNQRQDAQKAADDFDQKLASIGLIRIERIVSREASWPDQEPCLDMGHLLSRSVEPSLTVTAVVSSPVFSALEKRL